jgi:ABC-type dipeptide/oligopeptide/nickel transport system permease subunit
MADRVAPAALPATESAIAAAAQQRRVRPNRWLHIARQQPQLMIGAIVLIVLIFGALFAPLLAPYNPVEPNYLVKLSPPTLSHPFGTDNLGRDQLSRILYGARLSLFVGTSAVLIGMVIGVALGLVSGYRLGWLDSLIMRTMDGILAFPGLVLALSISFVLGPSLRSVIIALAAVRVPAFARIVRGQMLVLRNREYIEAAHAVGVRPTRIVMRHFLPNLVSIILVQVSLSAGAAIFTEASLAFLGFGVPPPRPDWGGMLHDGYVYLEINPWLSIIPGAFIFLAVLGFNFLGDGLRDALDPQQRRRRGL